MNMFRNINAQYKQLIEFNRLANLYITKTLDKLRLPDTVMAMRLREWGNERAKIFKRANLPESIFQTQIAEITKLSNFAQQIINRLPWNNIGALLPITPLIQDRLRSSLFRMSESYNQFWKALEINPRIIPDFSPIMIQQPPTDFYLATHLSNVITDEHVQLSKEETEILEKEHERASTFLCGALSQLNPELVVIYQGAVDSLNSENPDRQRHFSVSLRELFTHVLHKLSPDHEFTKWNTEPANLHNGKPTRRGRLLYIYRKINFSPFRKFIQKDVDAALTFVKLFEEGTHKAQGPFENQQCQALLTRMESLLYSIVKINPH